MRSTTSPDIRRLQFKQAKKLQERFEKVWKEMGLKVPEFPDSDESAKGDKRDDSDKA